MAAHKSPRRVASAAIFAAVLAASTTASLAAETPDCIDAEVSATVTRQTPIVPPNCNGCIIVSLPWFIDLKVTRVIQGDAKLGLVTVLSIQHTGIREDIGVMRWGFRRTTTGALNGQMFVAGEKPVLCPADTAPAVPYLRPANGKTLEDVRREGQAYYDRFR